MRQVLAVAVREFDRSDSLGFVGEDRLHLTRRTSLDGTDGMSRFEVTSVDVSTARWETRASFDTETYLMDPTWRFVLTSTGRERRLLDLEDGSTVGSFEARVHLHSTRWLSDGTFAVPDTTLGGGRVLRILDRDGTELRRIEFPNDGALRLGFEPRAGVLMTAVSADYEAARCKDRRLLAVDLETGTMRQVGKGLTPLWMWRANKVLPGSPVARTFIACDGRTVRFAADLESSETLLD